MPESGHTSPFPFDEAILVVSCPTMQPSLYGVSLSKPKNEVSIDADPVKRLQQTVTNDHMTNAAARMQHGEIDASNALGHPIHTPCKHTIGKSTGVVLYSHAESQATIDDHFATCSFDN